MGELQNRTDISQKESFNTPRSQMGSFRFSKHSIEKEPFSDGEPSQSNHDQSKSPQKRAFEIEDDESEVDQRHRLSSQRQAIKLRHR